MTNLNQKEREYLVVPSAGWLFGMAFGFVTSLMLIVMFLAMLIGKCS